MSFTAKDVAALRAATQVGMMDCKKALEACDGDIDKAIQYLREKGMTKAAERADRDNNQGCVALVIDGNVGAMVQIKCETDFVASSDGFKGLAQDMAALVAAKGEDAVSEKKDALENLIITLKENIEMGRVVRFEAAPGNLLDHYLHMQGGRGVNGVLVEVTGASQEQAHDVAVHAGFTKPKYLSRDEVSAETLTAERATLEAITRNEGKPEAAIAKIVEGRMGGFFKDNCLVEQAFVKDEKQTIAQYLGSGSVVRFAQILIG
jgi:elongation factor Ts